MIPQGYSGPGLKLDVVVGLRRRRVVRQDPKTSRHTHVAEEHQISLQSNQQKLGSAADKNHATPTDPGLEIRGYGKPKVRPADMNCHQPLAFQHIGQTLANRFNFGKLRHGPKVARTFCFRYVSVP